MLNKRLGFSANFSTISFSIIFRFSLTNFLCTLMRHNPESLSSPIVLLNHVLTLRSVLKERSTVAVEININIFLYQRWKFVCVLKYVNNLNILQVLLAQIPFLPQIVPKNQFTTDIQTIYLLEMLRVVIYLFTRVFNHMQWVQSRKRKS